MIIGIDGEIVDVTPHQVSEWKEKAESFDILMKRGETKIVEENKRLKEENDELRAQIVKVGGRVNRGDPDIKGYDTELFDLKKIKEGD